LEFRWGYADHGKRMFVYQNPASNHARVIMEAGVPVIMRNHDIRSAVCAVFIRFMKEIAKMRLNAQDVKIVSAHLIDPGGGRIIACVNRCLGYVECCQILKAAIAIAFIDIVRIGLETVVSALDPVKSSFIWQVQRTQNK